MGGDHGPSVILPACRAFLDSHAQAQLLLVGTAALALLGLESGTAFGGMGSSRHMTIAALVEPTVLVAVYALSIPVGTSALSAIVAARASDPAIVVSPVSLLAVVALALQDAFKASEYKAGTLGIGDDTFIIHFSIYAKVSFNSG